jgi:hypothetical protein
LIGRREGDVIDEDVVQRSLSHRVFPRASCPVPANANSAFAARACEKANPTSVPNPKFVLPDSTFCYELRIRKGHWKPYDSRAAYRFEVPGTSLRQRLQELQIGGTGGPRTACV